MHELSNIQPKKQDAFYRYFHPYFTKLPPNVASKYISFFSKPGDIVLDPFCGSGVVGIESILLNRKTICSDLSPLAVFISRQLMNHRVNPADLRKEFDSIKKDVLGEITKIWSYGDINLYKGSNQYFNKLKKEYWYPQGLLTYRSNIQSIEDLYDIRQMLTYAVLFDRISEIEDTAIKDTSLIAFFGAMSRANLTYMVSGTRSGSVLHNGGSSLFSMYDYRKPKNVVVVPVWERFERRFNDIVKVKEHTQRLFSGIKSDVISDSKVHKLDVLELSKKIRPESVDYVLTDPPYGGKIPYLELASMWSHWMGWNVSASDLKKEIIEGGELSKNQSSYVDLMGKSINEMTKVLKEGGSLSMIYQHNNIDVWSSMLEEASKSGLEFKNSFIQPTSTSTVIKKKFKGSIISAPLILNFKKKSSLSRLKSRTLTGADIKKLILKDIKKIDITSDEDVYNLLAKLISDSNSFNNIINIENVFNEVASNLGRKDPFHFSNHSSKK